VLVLEIGNEYAHFQRAFPDLVVLWLEVAAGNTQVGLMNYADLP
jgi:ribosomal protein L3 glutamine methyltransferase